MKKYFSLGFWRVDRRKYGDRRNSDRREDNVEKINKIDERGYERRFVDRRRSEKKKRYWSGTYSEAFYTIGIYFDFISSSYEIYKDVDKPVDEILDNLQEYSNKKGRSFYLVVFEDGSPVIYKGKKIILFEIKNEAFSNMRKVNKIIEDLGSEVVVQLRLIIPEN